jgi:hypothetical protein
MAVPMPEVKMFARERSQSAYVSDVLIHADGVDPAEPIGSSASSASSGLIA